MYWCCEICLFNFFADVVWWFLVSFVLFPNFLLFLINIYLLNECVSFNRNCFCCCYCNIEYYFQNKSYSIFFKNKLIQLYELFFSFIINPTIEESVKYIHYYISLLVAYFWIILHLLCQYHQWTENNQINQWVFNTPR